MVQRSMVQYIGPGSGGTCGYCKGKEKTNYRSDETSSNRTVSESNSDDGPSISFGVWGLSLTVNDYNFLLDLGWRRSGKYLYKPIMEKTCCPQYTIRLDVHKFRLSRTQKRVLKNMLEYLKFDKKPARGIHNISLESGQEMGKKKKEYNRSEIPPAKKEKGDHLVEKKKTTRRRRAIEKLLRRGINIDEYQAKRMEKEKARRRTIESYLEPYNKDSWKHKLEIRLVKKGTTEFDASFEESFLLYCKYQKTIHNDKDYTKNGYENFLVSTPLIPLDDVSDAFALGSYHQQYLIDGRIVAVGVIDILPRCLSSKYFYYDPDYAFLNMGTYSALREIAYTKELSKARPDLHYYYMGYYLINCPKMKYKGRFRPSDLLCDQSHQWVPLSEAVPMIENNNGRFTVFRPDIPAPPKPNINEIKSVFRGVVLNYGDIRSYLEDEDEWNEKMSEYVNYMGQLCRHILLCL